MTQIDSRESPDSRASFQGSRTELRDGETTIKIKSSLFEGGEGGGVWGAERKIVQNAVFFFRGKRHDNKILNVRILLSRNFVVITQAPMNRFCESGFGALESRLSFPATEPPGFRRVLEGSPVEPFQNPSKTLLKPF